jgi:RNA polymerase sigma factor (sigma-70 family)
LDIEEKSNPEWLQDLARVREALSDEAAYRVLWLEVSTYIASGVARYARGKRLGTEDARERLQVMCEKQLPEILAAFKGRSLLKTFIINCVRFRSRKVLRRLITEETGQPSLTQYEKAQAEARFQRRLKDYRERLLIFQTHENNLTALELRSRLVFTYFYGKGRSHEYIARELELSLGNVRQIKSRAKKLLEDLAGAEDDSRNSHE